MCNHSSLRVFLSNIRSMSFYLLPLLRSHFHGSLDLSVCFRVVELFLRPSTVVRVVFCSLFSVVWVVLLEPFSTSATTPLLSRPRLSWWRLSWWRRRSSEVGTRNNLAKSDAHIRQWRSRRTFKAFRWNVDDLSTEKNIVWRLISINKRLSNNVRLSVRRSVHKQNTSPGGQYDAFRRWSKLKSPYSAVFPKYGRKDTSKNNKAGYTAQDAPSMRSFRLRK